MPESYDCIVLGVGGFGSGVLYHLAKRGVRVLGLERFDVAHDRGSSHGETRIIRKAYFEHPDYVPLLLRAYELWKDLEKETNRRLCHWCGLFVAGREQGEAISGAKESSRLHGIPIEELSPAEAAVRFPGFHFPDDFTVVFEPEAGFLEVEQSVRSHVELARKQGAILKSGETVTDWSSDGRRVHLKTDRGDYQADRLIITAGAWTGPLLNELSVPLEVLRKPLFWHEASTEHYGVSSPSPAFYYEMPDGVFYGFPSIDGKTVKVAEHSGGDVVTDPSTVDRDVHPADYERLSRFLGECLPGIQEEPQRHSVCMYTHTPDRHFIIDRHPRYENVVIGAGFSGHGFKFTTVLGEALAELALDGRTDLPIGFLSLDRESLR